MPFREEILDQLQQGRRDARRIADDIVRGFPSIVSVALVGAWARGVVSPVDMDFVVVVRGRRDLRRVARYLAEFKRHAGRTLTLFYFETHHVEAKANRRAGTTAHLGPRRVGRVITRVLRKTPRTKRLLIRVLESWLPTVRLYEFPPQSFQTWLPIHDEQGFLAELQAKQAEQLKAVLTDVEQTLWQPNGFYELLESYLGGTASERDVGQVISTYDVDWREYLRRCVRYYPSAEAQRIEALYHRLTR